MPGLMNGSNKARRTSSIVSFRQVGSKAGLAPKTNGPASMFISYNIGGAQQKSTVPSSIKGYTAQIQYLKDNKLIQRNPANSGGIGRMYFSH